MSTVLYTFYEDCLRYKHIKTHGRRLEKDTYMKIYYNSKRIGIKRLTILLNNVLFVKGHSNV